MRAWIKTWIASALLITEAVWPASAATVDVNALDGGTTFTCCGEGPSAISVYLTPLYTFDGGTVDFGSVQLSPYQEFVGPSVLQVLMSSVSTSDGPLATFVPTVLYGDACVEDYGQGCSDLYYPTPITQSLSFAFPDNQTTEFQMAFIGAYEYSAPTVTPLPPASILMLTALIALAGLTFVRRKAVSAASSQASASSPPIELE